MGSTLFTDGRLCPGLELGHHPWKKKTYEDYLGVRGLEKYGKKRWNKRLQEAIAQTAATFNWDHLYLGGGNTKKIDFELPEHVSIVSNEDGILGGVALWRERTCEKTAQSNAVSNVPAPKVRNPQGWFLSVRWISILRGLG